MAAPGPFENILSREDWLAILAHDDLAALRLKLVV
jgi:hypothetical protein